MPIDFAAISRARKLVDAAIEEVQNCNPDHNPTSADAPKADRTRRGKGPWIEELLRLREQQDEARVQLEGFEQEIATQVEEGMRCGASLRALAELTGLSAQGVKDLHGRYFKE